MKKRNGWLYAFWIALIVILVLVLAAGLISWAGSGSEESTGDGTVEENPDGEGGGEGGGSAVTYDNTATFEAEDAYLMNAVGSSGSTNILGTEQSTSNGETLTNVKNFNTVGDKIVFQVLASDDVEEVIIDVTAANAAFSLSGPATAFTDNDSILTVNGESVSLEGELMSNPGFSFTYIYDTLTGTTSLNKGINYIEITVASTASTGYLNVDKIDLSWDGEATIEEVSDYTGEVFDVDATGVATLEAEDASLMNAVGVSGSTYLLGTETNSTDESITQVNNFNSKGDMIVYQVLTTAAVENVSLDLYACLGGTHSAAYDSDNFISVNGEAVSHTGTVSSSSYGNSVTATISLQKGINYIVIEMEEEGTALFGMNMGLMNVDRIDLNGGTGAEAATEVSDADGLAEALEEGGDIVLVEDIENIEDTFEVTEDTTLDLSGGTLSSSTVEVFTVSDGATLTITDSGEEGSISYTNSGSEGDGGAAWNTSMNNGAAIKVEEGGSLVMESGTIESTSVGVRVDGVGTAVGARAYGVSDDDTAAAVTISGGTIESEYYTIWASGDSTINIEGGTIAGTSKGLFVAGDDKFGYGEVQSGTTTLNISGGTISCKSDSAICTIGNTSGDHKVVNISGGTIIGPDLVDGDTVTLMPAIYNASGNLTITGGTITGSTAVEHRGGELTISGGTLVCNATGTQNTPQYKTSGATSYGYSLAIYPFDHSASVAWNKTMVVDITGGTFSGDIYISDNTLNGTDASGNNVDASISVSGGTVYGEIVLATGSSLNLSEIVGQNVMTDSTRVTAVAESDSRLVIDEEESTAFSATEIIVSYDSSTKTYTVSGTSVALSSEDGTLNAFWGSAASNHANCEYITFEVNVAAGETLKITTVDADGTTTKVRAMYGEGVTEKLTDENGDEIKTADGVWVIDVTKEDASQGSFKMTIEVIGEDGETVETYYVVIGTITSSATVMP